MEAIAAAAASLSVAAASGATSISSATSSPRSPRPASPGTGRRADGSEIEEDLLATPSLPSRESGSSAMAAAIPVGAVVPPHTLQPNLEIAEHAKLQAQADDVKNGEREVYSYRVLLQCRTAAHSYSYVLSIHNIIDRYEYCCSVR